MTKIVDISEIASALGATRRSGKAWRCRCPVCGSNTLDVSEGRTRPLLVHCWSCEDWRGVLHAIEELGFDTGSAVATPVDPAVTKNDDARRVQFGLKWWDKAEPLADSPAERYLAARGLRIRDFPGISRVLRFHPRARHVRSDDEDAFESYLPAMVALMAIPGEQALIKRGVLLTFLNDDGSARIHYALSRIIYGVAKGAGIYLGNIVPRQEYVVGEGIESTLSAMLLAGRSLNGGKALGGVAAISATGVKNLALRSDMTRLLIASDSDENETGQRAAAVAFNNWTAEGREVRVAYPPHVGTDFNDVLLGEGPYAAQAAEAAE